MSTLMSTLMVKLPYLNLAAGRHGLAQQPVPEEVNRAQYRIAGANQHLMITSAA